MKKSIDILLAIDFNETLKKLGLDSKFDYDNLITEENLYQIINEIEIEILNSGDIHKISATCALLWTHFSKEYNLLSEYLYKTMSRIGYSPILDMIKESDGKLPSSSAFTAIETDLTSKKYSINIFNKKYNLTEFQYRLWNFLKDKKRIAVSAPTSSGKSFILCLFSIYNSTIKSGINLYIVPNLSLLNQVSSDLINLSSTLGININILNAIDSSPIHKDAPIFYVLTQERSIDLWQKIDKNKKINTLVIDEVQNIEKAFEENKEDERSLILYDTIINIYDKLKPQTSIISGPRISDIERIGKELFGADCFPVITTSSPVCNIAYSISPIKNSQGIEIKQFSELKKTASSIVSENRINATGFRKAQYNEKYHEYLFNAIRNNNKCLIFSPTTLQSQKTALYISHKFKETSNKLLKSYIEFIKKTVSPNYELASCIKHEVAFHNSLLPQHIRNTLEYAISKNLIKHTFTTATLMQGVNIPAESIFMRNVDLAIKSFNGEKPKLTNYEISNLRGRAGRLLKDFVGRTFILDGTSFEEESDRQSSLFEPIEKVFDSSFRNIFENSKDNILQNLKNKVDKNLNKVEIYITNSILTEVDPKNYLERKGIYIKDIDIEEIKNNNELNKIPPDLIREFRYWNPYDLYKLLDLSQKITLPNNIWDQDVYNKLIELLQAVNKTIPEKINRIFGNSLSTEKQINHVAWTSIQFGREFLLSEILSKSDAKDIYFKIKTIQKIISYNIPKILMPIYKIRKIDPIILSTIENGIFSEEAKFISNHNISRDLSIRLKILMQKLNIKTNDFNYLLHVLKNKRKIPFWHAIQLRHILTPKEIKLISDQEFH